MGRTIHPDNRDKPYQFTSFQIKRELHRRLKVAAARTDQSMNDIVNRALEKYLMADPKVNQKVEDTSGFPEEDEE